MTEISLIIAALAESVEEGGFGFNFDILETNSINLAILIGVLVYYGRGVVGKILGDRTSRIAEAIEEAEERKRKAAEALADQQQKLALAQAEAERIRASARERANIASLAIATKTEEDIKRLQDMALQDLNAERERAIAELRDRVANLAIERVESRLKGILDNRDTQKTLIDRSIARIGGS